MKAKEIRAKSVEEIEKDIIDSRDKLFKQKIQKSLGQAESSHKIRGTRKDIAKLMTILAEKKRSNNG